MTAQQGDDDPKLSFEERLRVARAQQGMDAKPVAQASAGNFSAMGVGMRVGVELVSAIVVSAAIGFYLDRWLHTKPVLLAVFVLLGGAAGVANVWRLMGPKAPRP